jgi:hypothetical protein
MLNKRSRLANTISSVKPNRFTVNLYFCLYTKQALWHTDRIMKMYVWVDPYLMSYGGSMLYAVAESVEQAKQIAMEKALIWSFGKYSPHQHKAGIELGEPTRILDLPCAEFMDYEE